MNPRRSLAQATVARAILPLGLVAPAAAPWVWPTSQALAVGLIVGSHLPLLWGTFAPNRQMFGPVLTGFRGASDEVWLTIDDGPDPEDTPRVLDALDQRNARATFFVRGDRARRYPGLIEEIVRRGHELGNHTFSHPQRMFWSLPPSRLRAEMDGCNAALRDIAGVTPRWFRAPVGMVNPFVHPAAHERGMTVTGWSARAFDAGKSTVAPELVLRRITRDLRPGGIALLHEGPGAASGRAGENVRRLLEWLTAREWRAVIPATDAASSSAAPAPPR